MRITKLALIFIIAAFTFISCNDSASEKLSHAIPADATYIVNIDAKSLAEKSDYAIFQNVTVSRGINMAKALLSKEEAIKMLDAFTKDVNSFGIDIKGDCFIYTDYATYGLVLGVNDANKIKQALVNFSVVQEGELEEENGIYSLSPDKNIAICWNKETFLVVGNVNRYRYYGDDEKAQPSLLDIAKKQLTQDKSASINANPSFAKFMSNKKDISVFYSYASINVFEKMAGVEIPEEAKKELNDLKGIASLGFISFENGEIKTDSKVYYDTPETEKKYKELVEKITGNLKGDQLKYMVEKPIFLAAANLNGAGMYDYLNKLQIAPILEKEFARKDSTLNLKSIFEYFNGDVTFALNNIMEVKKSYEYGDGEIYEYDSTEPLFALLADVKDGDKLLEVILKNATSTEPTMIEKSSYSFNDKGTTYYMGVTNNNMFYVTNDKVSFDNLKSTDLKNNYSALVKNNVALVCGDVTNLKEVVMRETRNEKMQSLIIEGLDLLGTYHFTTSKDLTGEGKLIINDKGRNSFATICHYFDKVLTRLNDEIRF